MFKLQNITYYFLEPQELESPARCMVIATLDNDKSKGFSTLEYMLVGMQLNHNYMTTDRLFELLEEHFTKHKVTDYTDKLGEFVTGFIEHLRNLESK